MSPVTIAQLVAEPALRLRVLVPGDGLETLVRGAHISDLGLPGRYVLPGEAVLTNGLWLRNTGVDPWVEAVRLAGAVAIGVGVGEHLDAVPDGLVASCQRAGLPLFEVPPDISFSALAERIHLRNGTDEASSRLQLLRVRRLYNDLARGEGHAAVLDLLRRETRLPVWLVGPAGQSLTDDTPPDAAAAVAAARAARRRQLPCAVTAHMTAFAAGPDASPTTTVLVGAQLSAIDDDARLVLEHVGAYIALEDARRRERWAVRLGLAAELIQLLWSMELGATAFRLRLETLGFDADGPLMVVASSNALDDLLYGSLALSVTSVVAPHEDRQLLLIQSDDDGVVEELCVLVRDGGADPVLGCARAAGGPKGLRAAMAQALSGHQLAVGRAPGERIVRDLGIASHTDLVSFLDPHIQQAFHDAVLASIERWDLEHDAALLSTLAAFLANDGQLRRTAALMHIHHNTLHYRLDKIAQLTGRDARTTQGRTDFVLALALRRTQGPRRERLGERNTAADPSGPSTS